MTLKRNDVDFDITLQSTIMVLQPEYSRRTRSIPRLLMAWPGYHHPRHWLCTINRSWIFTRGWGWGWGWGGGGGGGGVGVGVGGWGGGGGGGYQLPVPSQCCDMIENRNTFSNKNTYFKKWINTSGVKWIMRHQFVSIQTALALIMAWCRPGVKPLRNSITQPALGKNEY